MLSRSQELTNFFSRRMKAFHDSTGDSECDTSDLALVASPSLPEQQVRRISPSSFSPKKISKTFFKNRTKSIDLFITSPPVSPNTRQRKALNTFIRSRKLVLEAEFEVGRLKLQSGDELTIPAILTMYEKEGDIIIRMLEDLGILVYHLITATTRTQYTIAIVNYVKHITGMPIVGTAQLAGFLRYFDSLFGVEVQSHESVFHSLRDYLDKYDEVKQSPVFQKLYKFIMYCMSSSIFDKVGLSFDNFNYTKIEQEALRRQYHMGPDFVHSMLDTLLFLCERGYQCMKTGSMDPIYHSGSRYEEWFLKAAELKRNSNFLTNPEPHGIDRFSYLAELDDSIESGNAIYKHASRIGDFEKRLVRNILADLEMIKSTEITKRAAQRNRKAPFSVLIYGGSSVAKSTFTDLLFFHYGKIFNLPIEDEFKYTRNPADPYWVNFNSTKWCVQLDDIAYLHPNVASNGDPSLMEMLQVINNVPFVPTQADLADKGRTPMNGRLVIATTNTEHLNAYAYFSCPLAVQRRLPWIIDIEPKPEFLKDGCMLDGNNVPEPNPGEYPNFWNITLKRVIPAGTERKHQKGTIVVVETFTHINDFLVWFSNTARAYDKLEDKVSRSVKCMKSVNVCLICCKPVLACSCTFLQALDFLSDLNTNFTRAFAHNRRLARSVLWDEQSIDDAIRAARPIGIVQAIHLYFYIGLYFIYLSTPSLKPAYDFFLGTSYVPYQLTEWSTSPVFWCTTMRYLGARVQRKIGINKILIVTATTLLTSVGLYKIVSSIVRNMFLTEHLLQGNIISQPEESSSTMGVAPTCAADEKPNVWYKDDYQTTTFDVSSLTTSLNGVSTDLVEERVARNCVHFRSRHVVDGLPVSRPNKAVCLIGHIYMTNNHGLPETSEFTLEIVQETATSGVTPNMSTLMTQVDIQRFPEHDLAFVRLRNLPPRRDITDLFCKPTFDGNSKGVYLARTESGGIRKLPVSNIGKKKNFKCPELPISHDVWMGCVREPTINGDCGSIMLAHSPRGPIILGMHLFGGSQGIVGAICITSEVVQLGIRSFGEFHIQGASPLLSAPSAPRILGALHRKSPVRYLMDGTANVYGSFEGFRPTPKSGVCPTFIHDSAVKHGYKVQVGKPIMSGWEPWRIAFKSMVAPLSQMSNEILDKCVEGYFCDIEHILTPENLAEVHVYDDFTAINGAAGVAYIDAINKSTSAGNPWKKSKKFYTTPLPPMYGLDEPVEVSPEIMERVDFCVQAYLKRERYCPNYCAHLKDEPVSFAKIAAKKTRVFTAAPFEYSIVVRKWLLSLVRLIQKNKLVFETAVGTICQSPEWEKIFEHLTIFGLVRMIAGDFKDYDKKMPPAIILAAFQILKRICERAGYTFKDILVVCGISEDTAFPLVDINGDLVMLYGSNPSGHPLTVIINSIANSLYMRYAFYVLSPNKSCVDFKKFVSLITYGDDNCMGVSEACPWFNHTAIQKVFGDVGIEYTMADKSAESVPYLHFSEISFLKRSWRWDDDVGAYLCPLEHSSIDKMLTMCVRSKTITMEAHSIQVLGTALREYFFYGKEIFEEKKFLFRQIIVENFLDLYQEENTLPPWEHLYESFWEGHEHMRLRRELCKRPEQND